MISVIVPVYNAEKFIDRCVNSIISQTYTDWELFLIDDGSKDNSLAIIKEYEKKDSRIRAIHQENQGAGAARNKGLSLVTGYYVVFVDSDDYIECCYFELLSEHQEDVVFIDVNRRNEDGNVIAKEKLSVLKTWSMDDILRAQMTGKVLWGGVRKAVKRSLLESNSIKYSQHKVGEEAIYSFLLLYYSCDYSFIDVPVYNYEIHSDSLSQSYQEDPWGQVAVALCDKVKGLFCYEQYANTLNAFFVTAGIVSLSKIAKKMSYAQFREAAYKKKKEMQSLIDEHFDVDTKHMNIKAKLLLPIIKINAWWLFYQLAKLK